MRKYNILNYLVTIMLLLAYFQPLKSENLFSNTPFYLYTEGKHLVFHPSGYMLVGGFGSGIKKSTDAGASFFDINTGLSSKFITKMACGNNGYIYAAVYGAGLFRSTNNGSNWSNVFNKANSNIIKSITLSPNGDLWIGTQGGGIYFSDNSGINWLEKNNGLKYRDVTSMISFNDDVILAGTSGNGVYKSSDRGENWYHSSPGLDTNTISCFYLDSLNQIYCGTQGAGVFISINGGADWVNYNPQNSPLNITSIAGFKTDAIMVGTNEKGIWRYDLTYENWRSPWQFVDGVNDLKLASGTLYYALQPYSGLWKTVDNLGYDWANKNLMVTTGYSAIAFIDDNIYVANGDNGMLRSTDLGVTWSPNPLLASTIVENIIKDSTGNLLATCNYKGTTSVGYIYKSTDNGLNWTSILTKNDTLFFGINVKPNGTIFVEASWPPAGMGDPKTTTHGTIFKSTNNGTSWTNLNVNVANPGKFIGINNNGDVFAYKLTGFSKTTNDGSTWQTLLTSSIDVADCKISKNNTIWLATSQGIKKSTNGGTTWVSYSVNATNTAAKKIILTNGGSIYVSVDNLYPYLIRTQDEGTNWEPVISGISHKNIESMVINKQGMMVLTGVSAYKGIESNDMIKPTLVHLKKDSAGVVLKPRFVWNKAKYADLYEFQLTNTTDFSNIIEDYVISDTTWTLNATLDYNSPYIWRVRSKTNASYSSWSEERMFYTMISPPKLVSPKIGATGLKTGVDFVWKSVPGAGQYYITISTDSTFGSGIIVNNKMCTDTIYSVTNLQLLTQYYWKVYAKTPLTTSDWSETWKFKTTLKPVTLRYPLKGSYGLSNEVTFKWDTTKSATNYFIEIALDDEFTTKIFAGNSEQFNSHTIKILELNTLYYWRVYGYSSEGYSDYSETWSFTTAMPGINLIYPENKSKDLNLDITFKWNTSPEATKYHLLVATDSALKNVLINDSNLTTNTFNYKDLNHYSTYYWKVRYKKNNLAGIWSETWNFSTNLDTPTLSYPAKNSEKMPLIVNLEWNKLIGAKMYEIQYATEDNFTGSLKIIDSIVDLKVETAKLAFNTKYYWRIRGKYDFGVSPWSEVWNFKTSEDMSDVQDMSEDKLEIYPNPFSDALNIKIFLKNDAKTSLTIYSNSGEEIFRIFDGYKGAGMHLFTYYPSSKISSGNYFMKIKANNSEIIKPVILNK